MDFFLSFILSSFLASSYPLICYFTFPSFFFSSPPLCLSPSLSDCPRSHQFSYHINFLSIWYPLLTHKLPIFACAYFVGQGFLRNLLEIYLNFHQFRFVILLAEPFLFHNFSHWRKNLKKNLKKSYIITKKAKAIQLKN